MHAAPVPSRGQLFLTAHPKLLLNGLPFGDEKVEEVADLPLPWALSKRRRGRR
jgi:hypothetical protein